MRDRETWQEFNDSFHMDKAACSAAAKTKPKTAELGAAGPSDLEPDNVVGLGDSAAAKRKFSDCMMKRGWQQK